MKKIRVLLYVVLAFVLAFVGYFGYLQVNYYRIDDMYDLTSEIQNNQKELLSVNTEYSIITNNICFGAYDHDFSFFMDEAIMKDGSVVAGESSKAKSEEIVLSNTTKAVSMLLENNPDFALLQEVDSGSTRSYYIRQDNMIRDAMENHASVYDLAMHTSYLFYPFTDPHGYANSGLVTLSKYKIDSSHHRQLPVDDSFITKFTDLDRCFTMSKLPIDNGKQLILINVHLSAYDEGGIIRQKQFDMLISVINEAYQSGNYVVVGGDFNHLLSEDYKVIDTDQEKPDWLYVFDEEKLGDDFRVVHSTNADEVGTCRSTDLPYTKGVNYQSVIDGFIVSKNVDASSEIIDTDYVYSDHNPVLMTFKLSD